MFLIDKGKPVSCHLETGWYTRTENLFIDVIAEYEDGDSEFCALTALPKNVILPYGVGYLNPMFPGGEKFIEDNHLGQPTGNSMWHGVHEYIEYQFDMNIINGITEE